MTLQCDLNVTYSMIMPKTCYASHHTNLSFVDSLSTEQWTVNSIVIVLEMKRNCFKREWIRTVWPSGLRRWLKAPVRKGVGSNPTAVICTMKRSSWSWCRNSSNYGSLGGIMKYFYQGQTMPKNSNVICYVHNLRNHALPPWPNGQGVGLLIRRLRVRVPQGVHCMLENAHYNVWYSFAKRPCPLLFKPDVSS